MPNVLRKDYWTGRERCSVVGTSYEAKLAKFASLAARVKLKDTVHKPGVYSLALKLLDRKKSGMRLYGRLGQSQKLRDCGTSLDHRFNEMNRDAWT